MENIVGLPHYQHVWNRANSLEGARSSRKYKKKYIKGLCALNFTLPVRAERHGHAVQTANRFLVFTI